ncbi:hypothetical protein AN640_06480 [Candidatus Epulonipiscium fishelsonii]|uniref:Uncharacterized protein n=1 Tax=Candidatus Epulonipiscium fishelsonii TaxID=77094 RepID=A0ACC8XHN8_9FIRM|nr:hypothetical protein AN640_06480 [Epulopiscium sp. SCG-D08WGA-EpuloA1]OON95899.1 MAG: hypothetical protein ATN32_06860 [Epulopiscium sp. AS2M-Bin002]
MKKFTKIIGIIAVGINLIGCSASEVQTKNEVSETIGTTIISDTSINDILGFENKANEVIVTEDMVTFIDGTGEKKNIKKNPERVVSLYTSHTALWYEAGGELIGRIQTSTSDSQLPKEALSEDVQIVAKSSSAKNISVESIIATDPDIVILGTAMSQPTLVEPLKVAGIETIVVDYENMQDYLKWFKVFSNLNNKADLYDTIAKNTLNETLNTLDIIKDVEQRPTVLNIYATSKSLSANLSTSMVGGMISAMKGINIADEWNSNFSNRVDINLEAVLVANPDKILVQQSSKDGAAKEMIEDLYGESPIWQSLDAVQNDEVYYLDMELFHYKPNSRFNEAYQKLGEIFYPELF